MISRKWISLLFSLAVAVTAQKTVVIDGADPQVRYTNFDTANSTYASWITVNRSPDSCDKPQQLTERPGDYATFTFTGTGIFIVGTVGRKRGLLGFNLNGINTTFDRTTSQLQCDFVLFQKTGLPNQQHTVIATLLEKQNSYVTGQPDGVLSIQRIRYTVPGSDTNNLPVIIGASVGGVALIAFFVGLFIFLRRKNRHKRGRAGPAYFDSDDAPSPRRTGAPYNPGVAGVVATPFQWNNQSHAVHSPHNAGQFPPGTLAAQSHYPESNPGSPTPAMPLLQQGSTSGPSSSDRRESQHYRDSKTSYVTSNPSVYGAPAAGDDATIDRIALRLADIMHGRAGPAMDAPPPMYEPGDSSVSAPANPKAPRMVVQSSASPTSPSTSGPSWQAADFRPPVSSPVSQGNVPNAPPPSAQEQVAPNPWQAQQQQYPSNTQASYPTSQQWGNDARGPNAQPQQYNPYTHQEETGARGPR